MMKSEFENLAGREVTNEQYRAIETLYMSSKTHIVDYEKIFDVCMNGDDLEFKKGLVRLQKMQNEYVMQREND